MKRALILSLAILSCCRKGIEGESICREVPPIFQHKLLRMGDEKEKILSQLGQPIELSISPFGRETWIYSHLKAQPTYSNHQTISWYLFDLPKEDPIHLILHLDENGKLTSIPSKKGDSFQINVKVV